MQPIPTGRALRWAQPSAKSAIHELRSDAGLFATLELRGSLGSASTAGGKWQLERDLTGTVTACTVLVNDRSNIS